MAGVVAVSCSDIDNQFPEGNNLTQEQVKEVNEAVPARIEATFSGMFSMMGRPHTTWPTGGNNTRADDFGFITCMISNDLEGADMIMADNGYNWFSGACALSNRGGNIANAYIRYVNPYRQIGIANEVISGIDMEKADAKSINMVAQARAMRAFDYMAVAPSFQMAGELYLDSICIPLLDGKNPYANNPRATVREVYNSVIEDLNFAVENLTEERSDKGKINKNVALGLRARANLFLGKYAEAAADAKAAAAGFTPASMDDLGKPAFCNAAEANWMWAILITNDMVQSDGYPTSSSWVSAFSGDGYAPATDNVPMINILLYNQIPDTDVRKGWWLDTELYSPLLDQIEWDGHTGVDISTYTITDIKNPFMPYYSVKFGMKDGIGSELNNNDWPLMRVEEMILIEAEGLARSGREAEAKQVLTNFVKTYRDPAYEISSGRKLVDEIWMQRRVELWGEGFATSDIKRLSKPIVRFHADVKSNYPAKFQFNVEAGDKWLNIRFPQSELDNNKGIVDNTQGTVPVSLQNPGLRDGVTD